MNPNPLKDLQSWCENLLMGERATTTVIALVGDMKGQCNHSVIGGDQEALVLTLAQQMVNDIEFLRTVKASLELVERYTKNEEKKEEKPKSTKKYLS